MGATCISENPSKLCGHGQNKLTKKQIRFTVPARVSEKGLESMLRNMDPIIITDICGPLADIFRYIDLTSHSLRNLMISCERVKSGESGLYSDISGSIKRFYIKKSEEIDGFLVVLQYRNGTDIISTNISEQDLNLASFILRSLG
jgi:hypothetical protein